MIAPIFEITLSGFSELEDATGTPLADTAGILEVSELVGEDTYRRKPPIAIVGELEPHAEAFRQFIRTTHQNCPPIRRVILRDALITYQGAVLTCNHKLLRESCEPFIRANLPMFGIDRPETDRFRLAALPGRFVERPSLLVKGAWWRNYGHWVVEGAALLALLRDRGYLPEDLQLVIGAHEDSHMRSVMRETLSRLCPNNPVLEHHDGEVWLISELHYISPIHIPPLFKSPHAFRALRDMLLPRDLRQSPGRRLYVRRAMDNRVLANEDQVIDLCRDVGFEVVEPGRLNLTEQVALFHSAEAVVGVKGAALTNLLFCAEGTLAVAMSPADFADAFYWDIAGQFDLDYCEIFGPLQSRELLTARNPFTIDLTLLAPLLDRIGTPVAGSGSRNARHRPDSLTCRGDHSENDVGTGELERIGRECGTDKSSVHHNYLVFYERFLGPLREQESQTILEIGVAEGASLRMWERYFSRAMIIGVDTNPNTSIHASERIRIEIADQSDVADLISLATTYGPFDLVLDDGSHIWDHKIVAFQYLYPFVRPGGYYIMEDIDTSYGASAEQYKGIGSISAVKYLQNLCDCMVGDVATDLSREPDAFLRSYARRTEFVAFHRRTAVIRRR